MQTTEIVGYKRANLGRQQAQELRAEGLVPCVLYGGTEQVSFYVPAYLFRELVFTDNCYQVTINIEGKEYLAILQDKQFHPVNDSLIHADFLEITPEKVIKVQVPIRLTGTSVGQKQGGKLVQTLRTLKVKGAAKDIPDYVYLDISALELGKAIKVKEIELPELTILESLANPVASITIPRALRQAQQAAAAAATPGKKK